MGGAPMATSAVTTPSSRTPSFSRLSPHLPPLKDTERGEGEGEGETEEEAANSGSEKSLSRKKRRSGRLLNLALDPPLYICSSQHAS